MASMLYNRDYKVLYPQEIEKKENAGIFKGGVMKGNLISPKDLVEYTLMLPAAWHFHNTLFPNNRLEPLFQRNEEEHNVLLKEFESLIGNSNSNERDVLNFINDNMFYISIQSLLDEFNTGNHGAYLFKEFPLSEKYKVDYLLIGMNSGGYEFVFIELEAPYKNITKKNGDFGSTIRKGISQIEDWDAWIDSYFLNLRSTFDKCKNSNKELPSEFINLDKSRIHFAIIAGRRSDFSEKTYQKGRKNRHKFRLFHYDNLIDNTAHLLAKIKPL